MNERIVYLMRGLPSCGKSHRARQLIGETGVVLETDEYFFAVVGDDPAHYDYDEKLLPVARQWNFDRFERALAGNISPIVVDRGNGLNEASRRYAAAAVAAGYRVELAEPDSAWWQEIRVLLKYKEVTHEILDQWAEKLAEMNRATHRTPASTIRRWMRKWQHDLTVDDILDLS